MQSESYLTVTLAAGASSWVGAELMVLWLVDWGALDISPLPRPLVPRVTEPLPLTLRRGLWAAINESCMALMCACTRSERCMCGWSAGNLHG